MPSAAAQHSDRAAASGLAVPGNLSQIAGGFCGDAGGNLRQDFGRLFGRPWKKLLQIQMAILELFLKVLWFTHFPKNIQSTASNAKFMTSQGCRFWGSGTSSMAIADCQQ